MGASRVFEIDAENLGDYLAERGVVAAGEPLRIEALGGGVSSNVYRVNDSHRAYIVKQPLEKLRVAQEWLFDRQRMRVERDALHLAAEWLPENASPRLIDSDEDNFIIVMTCAPPGGRNWKESLMSGSVRIETARRVGTLLASLHTRSAGDARARTLFPSKDNFIEGRIDPYFRTAAAVHPDVAPVIQREIDRLLARKTALVHGDYSPKNMIEYPDHVMLLDFEVAHFGDPSFDTGFVLNHLLMKAIRFPARRSEYLQALRECWQAYANQANAQGDIETNTVREAGALLLARIDGKSKAEYLTTPGQKDTARHVAKDLLLMPGPSIESLLALAEESIARLHTKGEPA